MSLRVQREIDAPAERVWALLTDTRAWPMWGPSVRTVDASERFIQLGTTGRITTPFGVRVPFRITELQSGHYWRWRVAKIPATGHRVEALGPGRCRAVFEVPMLAAPYARLCRHALEAIARLAEGGR